MAESRIEDTFTLRDMTLVGRKKNGQMSATAVRRTDCNQDDPSATTCQNSTPDGIIFAYDDSTYDNTGQPAANLNDTPFDQDQATPSIYYYGFYKPETGIRMSRNPAGQKTGSA